MFGVTSCPHVGLGVDLRGRECDEQFPGVPGVLQRNVLTCSQSLPLSLPSHLIISTQSDNLNVIRDWPGEARQGEGRGHHQHNHIAWLTTETCKILKQERLTAPQVFLELFQAIRQEYSLVFELCYKRIEEQVIYHTLWFISTNLPFCSQLMTQGTLPYLGITLL